MSVRESNLLRKDVFNIWALKKRGDETHILYYGLVSVISAMVVPVSIAALSVGPLYIGLWSILPALIWIFTFFFAIPNLGRLHPAYSIRHKASRLAVDKYYELDKADRREFPSNIITVLADPDLTESQRVKVTGSMNHTLMAIEERNAQRAALRARNVDISSVVEDMERNRRGLWIETETLRELS